MCREANKYARVKEFVIMVTSTSDVASWVDQWVVGVGALADNPHWNVAARIGGW